MGLSEEHGDGSIPSDCQASLLVSSSVKDQQAGLSQCEQWFFGSKDIPVNAVEILVHQLFRTYSFYIDRNSIRAVLKFLRDDRLYPPFTSSLLDLYTAECSKKGLALSNALALVEWGACILLKFKDNPKLFESECQAVVRAIAQAFEISQRKNGGSRRSLRLTAAHTLQRSIGSLASTLGQDAVRQMVGCLCAKESQLGLRSTPTLGVIGSACATDPVLLESSKQMIYAFYITEVLGARTTVPVHLALGLKGFLAAFTSFKELSEIIVPALEKALLRAPEIVLESVVVPLVQSIDPSLDLAEVLADHLLRPLLSSAKAQKDGLRKFAALSFAAIAGRCREESAIKKTVKSIVNALSQAKAPAERLCLAHMLESTPEANDYNMIEVGLLCKSISKESNEETLNALVRVLFQMLRSVEPSSSTGKECSNLFQKGMKDKKSSVRRIWILSSGHFLNHALDATNIPRAQGWLPPMLQALLIARDEAHTNTVLAAQHGTVVVSYILVALWARLQKDGSEAVRGIISKTKSPVEDIWTDVQANSLLNPRVYSKLDDDDVRWLVQSLQQWLPTVKTSHRQLDWGSAFIFAITSSLLPPQTRKGSAGKLTDTFLSNKDQVTNSITVALWQMHRDLVLDSRDSAAHLGRISRQSLSNVIRAITPPRSSSESVLRNGDDGDSGTQMIDLLVLCQKSIIPGVEWINTCLRVGQDPGRLADEYLSPALDEIDDKLSLRQEDPDRTIQEAASNAAAELAFVNPTKVIPSLLDRLRSKFSPAELQTFGPTEIAIAHLPEGVAFVDVLASNSQKYSINKNSPDYEIAKWEQQIKKELAEKRGQNKKLTADEKARVDAQLRKEVEIRERVLRSEENLRQGARLVQALVHGPPIDPGLWLQPALAMLIEAIKAGCGLLVGSLVDETFLECANFVSPRLGIQRHFVGVTMLRALESGALDPEVLEEPLQEACTRLLHRLHFLGAQMPFDALSLMYLLPLALLVLERGGLGQCAEETADEQVTLSLEFVDFHASVFSSPGLPRGHTLSTLLVAMQRYGQHFKTFRSALHGISQAISPSISASETQILLAGTISLDQSVRMSALQAVREFIDLTEFDFCVQIWISCHDEVEENANIGKQIWEENALDCEPQNYLELLPYLIRSERPLRVSSSRALADCIGSAPQFDECIENLEDEYRTLAKPPQPEKDVYGMIKKSNLSDPWEARHGIALAFKELAPEFPDSGLVKFIEFLVQDGALGDRNMLVRDEMIRSGTFVIAMHGAAKLEPLMKTLEYTLDEATQSSTETTDLISEAAVILYGSLARHLPQNDQRTPKVIRRLLSTLSTPSESVQVAVADCLPPLAVKSRSKTSEYIDETIERLLRGKTYAVRRGAAYGLAGLVKGTGILALKEHDVLTRLHNALEDKKDVHQRQGSLLAYEIFPLLLGKVFEPYTIQIVPQLLTSFGDANADVRDACLDAAKSCFSYLSSYGVKIILPILLSGLDESQWRSKRGACEMLGAMAYLDPQQLAESLPDIIPPLTNVLNDSHKEVRAAANRSLQRFGDVISNPEVKSLVSVLLKALSDPTKYTEDALEALIKVSFVHYLDSPSLALVVRILQRGLSDRSATKKKAAQIIGSLAHLTEKKDITIYLPILVAGLRAAAVDPVPVTRATASKALGSLVEKLGEEALPDLIPSLMMTLKSDTGAGDRLGSAQALSEVLAGLGTPRLEETLPTILQNVSSTKPTVREGFMTLFIYLPACFGNSFATYLKQVIPPILAGLADELEAVREISLRAGRLLVKNFASKAIDLLLPELDRGLADKNYRIRLSSVELVGDLLFNLTGISGKAEETDEEAYDTSLEAGRSLLEVLGEQKRNKVLSSLFICRCDTSGQVRSAAINVWKTLVPSPRILKELVPSLSQLLIKRLASSDIESREIASNALGELIRKAGEGVLSSLLPTLEEDLLTSTDVDHRQGICIALRELIASASPEALQDYEKTLISITRVALVDPSIEVREAAAEAFDALQQILGKKAVDQVLPHLLNLLRSNSDANTALSALLTLLKDNTRSNAILPNLVPTLLVSPISAFNARAIASLAQVAGQAMNRRLTNILNSVMDGILSSKEDEHQTALEESFDSILLSVDEYDGLNIAMNTMLTMVKSADHRKRANAGYRLQNFFAKASVDFSRYYQDLIRVLLLSFDDADDAVVKTAWAALSELTKKLKKEEMESLVASTRQTLQQVGVAGANLAGFMLPKGINAILPIFLQGLMNGTADQRTNSALAISEIINRCSEESLKPSVTQITGPLIRVVSERSTDVKAAILLTLNNLLEKIPTLLKPFLPQLQRTFAKCLADPSSDVLRTRAAKALGTLITLTPRVDPLIAELVTGSKTPDSGVQAAMIKALFEVVSKAGQNMNENSRNSILGLIDSDTDTDEDSMIITNAKLFGALIKSFPAGKDQFALVKSRALSTHITKQSVLNLNAVLLEAPSCLLESFAQETINLIAQGIQNKLAFIADNAVLAAGKFLLTDSNARDIAAPTLLGTLASTAAPGGSVDTRRLALVVIRTVSRIHPDLTLAHLPDLVPGVFAGVRDPVIPVKLAAESAFVAMFQVTERKSEVFDGYMAEHGGAMTPAVKRSTQDYFKRVTTRLGVQARERKEAEGGQGGLGLSNDEREDEKEVYSVGKVDLGEASFE